MSSVINKNLEQLNDLAPIYPSDSIKGGIPSLSSEDQERVPSFFRTIGELKSLSTVIETFHCRWDELQKHLEYIESAIESQEKQLANVPSDHQLKDPETVVTAKEGEPTTSVSKESESSLLTEKNTEVPSLTAKESKVLPLMEKKTRAPSLIAKTDGSSPLIAEHTSETGLPNHLDQKPERTSPVPLIPRNSLESELQMICRNMCGRDLRRYIVARLSQPSNLREELPKALSCAPNPAKLVLESVGRFFAQGSKAFNNKSPHFAQRQAAILVLEQFLLLDRVSEIDQSVKLEAAEGAMAWRKRLVFEGGVGKAVFEDARGLLLLVSCFGIPDPFTLDDLIRLLRLGGMRSISKALSKSASLLGMMPQIIDCMRKEGMEIEAIDTIYSFRIEDKFSPQHILEGLLKNLKGACKKAKKARSEGQGSLHCMKEASQKHLSALKSVKNCLEAHKIDPASVIPRWEISEEINSLEKDIAEMNKRIALKRKTEEQSTKISCDPELKRSKVVIGTPSIPTPSPFSSLQEPRVDNPPVYHLYNRYAEDPVSRYLSDSAWPRDYTNGMSNRVGQHGASLSSNISSGYNLLPPVSSFGIHERNSQSSSEMLMGDRFVRSMDLGNRPRPGPTYTTEGAPSFAESSRSPEPDLYRFADSVGEGQYNRGYDLLGTMRPSSSSYRSSFL